MDLENPEETLVIGTGGAEEPLVFGCNKYTARTILEFGILGLVFVAILVFILLMILRKPNESV